MVVEGVLNRDFCGTDHFSQLVDVGVQNSLELLSPRSRKAAAFYQGDIDAASDVPEESLMLVEERRAKGDDPSIAAVLVSQPTFKAKFVATLERVVVVEKHPVAIVGMESRAQPSPMESCSVRPVNCNHRSLK